MKKLVALPIIFSLIFMSVAFSQEEPPENIFGCTPEDTLTQCALRIGRLILRLLMVFALIVAAIMIAWGGIMFITQPGKEQDARKKIVYAAIGLVIAFIAWALALLIKRFALTGQA
jgi:hypothetical protein